MEPVLLTAAFSLIPWNNPRNWVYQLFTTYLGYAVNKLKGGGFADRLVSWPSMGWWWWAY